MQRRTWLKLAIAGTVGTAASLPFLRPLRVRLMPVTRHERQTLRLLVDLLVPRDETPGAVDLGIDRIILARVESLRQEARRLANACLALDRLARGRGEGDFRSATQAAQIAMVMELMADGQSTYVARTLRALRRETMTLYYARPESWAGLGIHAPPQPAGYPGYATPPGRRTP